MTILRSTMFPSSTGTLRSTRSIVNAFSTNGYTAMAVQDYSTIGGIATLSGALTASTLKTMLNISGTGGTLSLLTVKAIDTTSRTMRVKITCDGIVVYDSTSAANVTTNNGAVIAGIFSASNPLTMNPIYWTSTLLVELASSLTETDKLSMQWIYNLEA